MFGKYFGPQVSFPELETTYWLDISNYGVTGAITVAIRQQSADASVQSLLWSKRYESFEAFALEWEIV
jgi:hypothetical protein